MKTILFTGATDGIGLEAARQLVSKGHNVLMHGRNPAKLSSVARELGVNENNTFVADLSDISQVYAMANDVKTKHGRLDVVVNNAGILKAPNGHELTEDGLDIRIAVNTAAPYVLTKELLPIIPKHGRVINLSSAAQAPVDLSKAFPSSKKSNNNNTPYSTDFDAYSQSKLAIMMWNNGLAVNNPQHILCSLNPGSMINTNMVKTAFGGGRRDISVGADIIAQAAVGKQFAHANGKYFDNDRNSFGSGHPDANNKEKIQSLITSMDDWLLKYFNNDNQQCLN